MDFHKQAKNKQSCQNSIASRRMLNQKLNSYLKEVADLFGIDINLTFHLAGYTFVRTVTLNNDFPIESVSKKLSHSRITTTQIYAKVVEKKVSEEESQTF